MREDDGIRFRHMLDAAREAVEFSQFPQVRNLRHVKRKKNQKSATQADLSIHLQSFLQNRSEVIL